MVMCPSTMLCCPTLQDGQTTVGSKQHWGFARKERMWGDEGVFKTAVIEMGRGI